MNISSISSSTTNASSTVNNSSAIAQLEKQKSTLQTQLSAVGQSQDDAKTKQDKTAQIQAQIQLIDAQIAQMRSEKSGQNQVGQKTTEADSNKNGLNSVSVSANYKEESTNNIIDILA